MQIRTSRKEPTVTMRVSLHKLGLVESSREISICLHVAPGPASSIHRLAIKTPQAYDLAMLYTSGKREEQRRQ
jgi:hypothetical protein